MKDAQDGYEFLDSISKIQPEKEEKEPNPLLNVYYYSGKTYITIFGSCLPIEKAKDITAKLISEGAESSSLGVAVFPRELKREDFEIMNKKYQVDFYEGIFIQNPSKEYWNLKNTLELPR